MWMNAGMCFCSFYSKATMHFGCYLEVRENSADCPQADLQKTKKYVCTIAADDKNPPESCPF